MALQINMELTLQRGIQKICFAAKLGPRTQMPYSRSLQFIAIASNNSLQQLFTIAKTRKQSKCLSTEEWLRLGCGMYYIQWNTTQP